MKIRKIKWEKKLIPHPYGESRHPLISRGYNSIVQMLCVWDGYLADGEMSYEKKQRWLTTLLKAQKNKKLKQEIKKALEDALEHRREKKLALAIEEINFNFDRLKKTIEKK